MRVVVKCLVIFSALAVATLACGGGGDDETRPTGTVLAVSATASQEAPDDNVACVPEARLLQVGDTLSARALEFDVSAEAIADAGDLSDPNVLAINQELTIPCRVFEAAPPQATSTPAA